jgi:hypothetical protein
MNKTIKIWLTMLALAALTNAAFAKKEKKPSGVNVSWKDVPAAVQTTIQNNLAGGKVKQLNKETVNGVLYYYAEVKGTDGNWTKVCIRDTGALVKVEPDKARNKRKHKPLFG